MKDNIYNLIKNNPDGIERESLISIINDQLHISNEDVNKYLLDLIIENKINLISDSSFERFQSVENQAKERELDIKIIGVPQSCNATFVLNQTLISYPDDLILVLDIAADETEIALHNSNDISDMEKILNVLGYPFVCEVDKHRTVYKKDNIKLVFDIVKNLGNFIEIEMIGDETQENENILFQAAKQLSLEEKDRVVKKGYPDLILQ